MTAVAPPITFQQLSRTSWNTEPNAQGGLDSMSAGEVSRMLMPRKGAQRSNSSSSLASTNSSSSSTSTLTAQVNGQLQQQAPQADSVGWSKRKVPNRGLWPPSKAEPTIGVSRGPDGGQQSSMLPSQRMLQSQQNGAKGGPSQSHVDGIPVLNLSPMNNTFDRKQITVPWFPEVLRIGRQTNAKTVPTPTNGFFDSKVLSRQHAEIWADRFGKIFIKDVKSSNGTFVNGQRLSQENRDSDPHELRESDILELGIDIVSEDQKTVVHHKVAARVEHAGLVSNSSEILNLNFGDIDPTAVGGMNGSNVSQAMTQLRRSGSQGMIGGNGRVQGLNGGDMGRMGQRNMNFWLTPITMEQIVKRLSNEIREASTQASEINNAKTYFHQVESPSSLEGSGKKSDALFLANSVPQANGIPPKPEGKSRFLGPPAPPPSQPLPEKPDMSKSISESALHPSLNRSDTAKPALATLGSPPRDSSSQILSLVEALTSAKREIEMQGSRLKDLEGMLEREREARETAETRASKLEAQSNHVDATGDGAQDLNQQRRQNTSRLSRLFSTSSPKSKQTDQLSGDGTDSSQLSRDFDDDDSSSEDDKLAAESAARLQQKLDLMVAEMNEMKLVMEKYKRRVEDAEEDAKSSRASLAEMVEKLRKEEAVREAKTAREQRKHSKSSSTSSSRSSPSDKESGDTVPLLLEPELATDGASDTPKEILKDAGIQNGKAIGPTEVAALEQHVASLMAQVRREQLVQSAPYASILAVVFVGVGLMTYLNGWQKVDK